jgi:hypothetical protein
LIKRLLFIYIFAIFNRQSDLKGKNAMTLFAFACLSYAQTKKALRNFAKPEYDQAIAVIPKIADLIDRAKAEEERCGGDVDDALIQAYEDTDEIIEFAKRGEITPLQLWAIAVIRWDDWESVYVWLNEIGFDQSAIRDQALALAA